MVYGFNNIGKIVQRNKSKYKLEIIFGKDKDEYKKIIKYEISMLIKEIEFNKETIIIFSNNPNKYILDTKYNKYIDLFVFDESSRKSGLYTMLDYFKDTHKKTWVFIEDIKIFDDIGRAIIPHLTKNNYLTITTANFNPFLEKAYELIFKQCDFQIIWLQNKITNDDCKDIKKLSEQIRKDKIDLFDVLIRIRKNKMGHQLYVVSEDIEQEESISEKNILPLHKINFTSNEYWKEKEFKPKNKLMWS